MNYKSLSPDNSTPFLQNLSHVNHFVVQKLILDPKGKENKGKYF